MRAMGWVLFERATFSDAEDVRPFSGAERCAQCGELLVALVCASCVQSAPVAAYIEYSSYHGRDATERRGL